MDDSWRKTHPKGKCEVSLKGIFMFLVNFFLAMALILFQYEKDGCSQKKIVKSRMNQMAPRLGGL